MNFNSLKSSTQRAYPCRCCRFLTISDCNSGTYEICPICFWEDDPVQAEDPLFTGGANRVSLNQARMNFQTFGATEERFLGLVRGPNLEEVPSPPMLNGLDAELRDVKTLELKLILLQTVRSITSGRIAILAGCTVISSVAAALSLPDELAQDFLIFHVVTSEIDDFPQEGAREPWSPMALAAKDAELTAFEGTVRKDVLNACARLDSMLTADLRS